ncbi:hypothetical protein QVD17_24711 [Tagetes erecta]|uniref:Uncharacterized protein n=1 Tax=Tagetes erecta TaxID=13708 RepID=A0AAD8KFE3_TARER|nr:hypothetical protein QVD17_24711 [Tagetes erecta]
MGVRNPRLTLDLTFQFSLCTNPKQEAVCNTWVDKETVMENDRIRSQTTRIMIEARDGITVMTEDSTLLVQMIQCTATYVLVKRLEV